MRINVTSDPRQFEEVEVTCISLESNPSAELSLTVLGNDQGRYKLRTFPVPPLDLVQSPASSTLIVSLQTRIARRWL